MAGVWRDLPLCHMGKNLHDIFSTRAGLALGGCWGHEQERKKDGVRAYFVDRVWGPARDKREGEGKGEGNGVEC